jgi:quercetin dioxygenase-like cupin family protein
MSDTFYIGSYRDDALNGANYGWIVGTFIKDAPRKNKEVEVKYWQYKKGEIAKDYQKTSSTIECTFILKGKTSCLIYDQSIELNAGDYIVIKPGTPNNTVAKILEDTEGLTIKAPSDPSAKKIVARSSGAPISTIHTSTNIKI